jgi:hypothetical protein
LGTLGPPLVPPLVAADCLAGADGALRAGLARDRLGPALADALRRRLADAAPRLVALDRPAALVHGDFGGRNVIVRDVGGGRWAPVGVLDWETAAVGSRLWDVGSLFRYPRRYGPAFRAAFADGYRSAGGSLPADWWAAARLLDATRLVALLAAPRELPTVFADCRDLIATLVAEDAIAGDAPIARDRDAHTDVHTDVHTGARTPGRAGVHADVATGADGDVAADGAARLLAPPHPLRAG